MRDRYGEPEEPEPTIIVHNHHHTAEAHTHIGDSDHTDQWRPQDTPEYRAWWKQWLDYCRQTLGVTDDDVS